MPLRRRSDEVRAPDEEVAREILGRIGIFRREVQLALLEAFGDELLHVLEVLVTRRLRLVDDLLPALVECRVGWQPAETRREHVVVAGVAIARFSRRRDYLLCVNLVAPPLIGAEVEERCAVLQTRRRLPVRRRHDARPALRRTQLLLPDVVRPAAAVPAFRTDEEQEVQDRAVDDVGIVPVVDACAHDDHGSAVRLDRVVRHLARRVNRKLGRDARVLFLPMRRVRHIILVGRRRLAAEAAIDRIVRHRQVVDRRHEALARRRLDFLDRHHALQESFLALRAEVRQSDFDCLVLDVEDGKTCLDRLACVAVLLLEIPLCLAIPAVAHRAVRHDESFRHLIHDVEFEVGVLLVGASHILRIEEASGQETAVLLLIEKHEEREIRKAAHIVDEERLFLVDVVLLQDDMPHRHGESCVAARVQADPRVGDRRRLRVVGRDGDDLRALVAHLCQEMRIGRARQRHVRTPRDDVACVVPIARLRHVRLVAPDLRACRRQIGVPVVEGKTRAAHELHEAKSCGIAEHRLCGNDGKAEVAVRTVLFYRVEKRRGDELRHLVPIRAHEAAHAARRLVALLLRRIVGDAAPRLKRRLMALPRLAPKLRKVAPEIRVLDAQRAVEIPRERSAARTATRLKVRHIGRSLGIVKCLILPSHEAVLHIDVPAARPRAVHAVRRTHPLVERPAVAVHVLPVASTFMNLLVPARRPLLRDKITELLENAAHFSNLLLNFSYSS